MEPQLRTLAKAGYKIAISNSRGPESLTSLVNSIGSNVKATTIDDAIKFAMLYYLHYRGEKDKNCYRYQNCLQAKLL